MRTEQDRSDFSALAIANSRSMFRAARAILPSDAAAEDAVGEAILRAWQAFHRLRDRSAAKSWLLKITVNCAREQYRKLGRETSLEDMAWEPAAPETEDNGLWLFVQSLPNDMRIVITLYYYEDMSVAEIARVLGIPQGTVKSRLSRGRERLRRLWKEEQF